jgi:hypothetical protein
MVAMARTQSLFADFTETFLADIESAYKDIASEMASAASAPAVVAEEKQRFGLAGLHTAS